MSWDDDDDDDNASSFFTSGWLTGPLLSFGCGGDPKPMTNAGRYLEQMRRGESNWSCTGEAISDELQCVLRGIAIKTAAGRVDQPKPRKWWQR